MKFKYALSILAIFSGIFGAVPIAAMVLQNQAADGQEVPEAYIVVSVHPPLEAIPQKQSEAPIRITERRDPGYVRCRMEPVAGTILKKRKMCMTNREWRLGIRKGNQYAREFVDDNRPGIFR
ncbi:hypothetical protein [Parasphingorhabdus sp.]|uniref:hypothetical protein n=1 Tax=Parasphingorhabdus sp. TaxID=2709688 RepID=UPI0030029DCD